MVSVGLDLTCAECGYNLRGLPADSRCPECGAGVGYSLDVSLRSTEDDDAYEHFDALVQTLYARVAAETGKTEEGMRMVAAAAERPSAGDKLVPADVCRRLYAAATEYHGDGAGGVLTEAGLHTGADVGRVVDALARAGLIVSRECEGNWAEVGEIGQERPGELKLALAEEEPDMGAGGAGPRMELLATWSHRLGLSLVAVGVLFGLLFLPGFLSSRGSALLWGALIVLAYFIPGFVLWQCASLIRDGSRAAVVTSQIASLVMILVLVLETVIDMHGLDPGRAAMGPTLVIRGACCVLLGVFVVLGVWARAAE